MFSNLLQWVQLASAVRQLLGERLQQVFKLIPGAGTIMGGTAAAGTAAALTFDLGKTYIGTCKSIKTGKLNLDELSQKKGQGIFKEAFRDEMKKKK